MVWNWDTRLDSIVFASWTADSGFAFVAAVLAIYGIAVCHEWLMQCRSRFRRSCADSGLSTYHRLQENASGSPISLGPPNPRKQWLVECVLYGLQIWLSIFLMLVAMSFNGYLIGAIIGGAATGHYLFEADEAVEGIGEGQSPR